MKRAGNCEAGKLASESDDLCAARLRADALSASASSAVERLNMATVIRGIDDRLANLAHSATFEQANSHEGAAYQIAVLGDVIAKMAAEIPASKMDSCFRMLHSLGAFVVREGKMKATPSMAHMLPEPNNPLHETGTLIDVKPTRKTARHIKNSRVKVPLKVVDGGRQAAKAG